MPNDSEYRVRAGDWPAGSDGDEVTMREMYQVLDQFDTYYPAAVRSLAQTPVDVPRPDSRQT